MLRLNYLPRRPASRMHRAASSSAQHRWELPAAGALASTRPRMSVTRTTSRISRRARRPRSTMFLPRDLQLAYRNDVWRLRADLLQFQTLRPDSQLPPASDRPYAQLPRLTARGTGTPRAACAPGFDTRAGRFHAAPCGVSGWRAQLHAGSWLRLSRGRVTTCGPAPPGTSRSYSAALTARRADDTHRSRSLPIISIDTGLQLERAPGRRRDAAHHARTATATMSTFPIATSPRSAGVRFTALPDPNFVSLFRANRYVGSDRIGDANELTLGVTTRMSRSQQRAAISSAPRSARASPGDSRASRLPGESPDTRHRSDLIANIDLRAYRNCSLRYDVAWNPQQLAAPTSPA